MIERIASYLDSDESWVDGWRRSIEDHGYSDVFEQYLNMKKSLAVAQAVGDIPAYSRWVATQPNGEFTVHHFEVQERNGTPTTIENLREVLSTKVHTCGKALDI